MCAINIKPTNAAEKPTAAPTILGGAPAEYTGVTKKIVTDLPTGIRYAISTEYIDPTTIDAGKIVPTGYTALDYLESTGTQYIDTGFATTTGMVARTAVKYNDSELNCYSTFLGSWIYIAGNKGGKNYAVIRKGYYNSNHEIGWAFGFGNHEPMCYYGTATDAKYTLQFSTISGDGYLDIDGNRVITDTSAQTTPDANVMMFSPIIPVENAENKYGACVNLYYATLWNSDGNLVRDFVPVRGNKGELGMYDLVENKLYTNDGTVDDFVAGEEVNTALKNKNLVWANNVDDPANQIKLEYNQKYLCIIIPPTLTRPRRTVSCPSKNLPSNATPTFMVIGQ